MKKHINVSDFIQLTEEHREHLRDITDYTNISKGFYFYSNKILMTDLKHSRYEIISLKNKVILLDTGERLKLYPCFTIGDMIEILEDNNFTYVIDPHVSGKKEIAIFHKITNKRNVGKLHDELCDCLWECIKGCIEEGLI